MKMNQLDYRDRILELAQNGCIDPLYVIQCFVRWNTNSDIKKMCQAEDIQLWDEWADESEVWE